MFQYLTTNGPWSLLGQPRQYRVADTTCRKPDPARRSFRGRNFRCRTETNFRKLSASASEAGNSKALFIPDIDKWEKWNRNLASMLQDVDYALVDGTFFANGELPGRSMSEIPHPFVKGNDGTVGGAACSGA